MILALLKQLKATSSIVTIVGDRIDVQAAPVARDYPRITLTLVVSDVLYSTDGETGLESTTIQIDAWDRTYSDADRLARAVRALLTGFRGEMEGQRILGAFMTARRSRVEQAKPGESRPESHRISADYRFLHTAA